MSTPKHSPVRHAPGEVGPECGQAPFTFPTDFALGLGDTVTCPPCRTILVARGECPNCGEEKTLAWAAGPVKLNQVADGRLTMRDVETQFYLGCEECSETLIHGVSADEVARFLTATAWRPKVDTLQSRR